MSQGATSLSSGGVTVRAVGSEGRAEPPPVPAKIDAPKDPPPQVQVPTPPAPPPPQPVWWAEILKFVLRNWQWAVVSVLALIGAIGAFGRRPPPGAFGRDHHHPRAAADRPADQSVLAIKPAVEIPTGTQQHKPRLRLYPLGHNDLPPKEALFEGELTMGRNEDCDICIFNDS